MAATLLLVPFPQSVGTGIPADFIFEGSFKFRPMTACLPVATYRLCTCKLGGND
jgi:hypothetical protein